MKKMFFGVLLTFVGTIFTVICFTYAINHQYSEYNGHTGLWTAFVGHDIAIPTLLSLIVLVIGVAICGYESYRKHK